MNQPLPQADAAFANQMRQRPTPSRILAHGACALLFWAFVIFGVGILGLILTGYQPIATSGQSMQPTIVGGSLVLARQTLPEHVRVGDIIAFRSPARETQLIVHRVIALGYDGVRTTAITKGDYNLTQDPGFVTLAGPLPKGVFAVPYLGWPLAQKFEWCMFGIIGLLGLRVLPLSTVCSEAEEDSGSLPEAESQ